MTGSIDTRGLLIFADSLSDGLVAHRDGIIVYSNKVALRMLHYEKQEALLGKPILELLHPEAQPRSLSRLLEENQSPHRLHLSCQGGEILVAEVKGFPILYEGVPCVLTLLRPLGEAQRMNEQVQELNRVISMNSSIVSALQDLNNPLSYVLTDLSYAVDEVTDIHRLVLERFPELEGRLGETVQALQEAEEGAKRILSRLVDLGKLRRNVDERRERVDIQNVMEQALLELQSELSMKENIRKEYRAAPLVEASRARLVQAIVNVIRNSMEAVPVENAENHHIWLRTKTSEDGYALLEIEDNGVGLGDDLIGRVFEPFFTTKAGATGVGLAVSRGILVAIGGTITLQRRSPGTLVQIRLPPYRRRSERGNGGVARVLIIDDEEKVCTALRRILGGTYQTSIQVDPREALTAFRKGERYDLVFCDLRMPHLSGQDLYRELERIAPEQAERVVFMTADPERAAHSQFLCSVSNFYVEKPFDTQRVRELAIEAMK